MSKQREIRTGRVELRLTPQEKKAFQDAADYAGLSLSSWMRERLRKSAIIELEEAEIEVEFFKNTKR